MKNTALPVAIVAVIALAAGWAVAQSDEPIHPPALRTEIGAGRFQLISNTQWNRHQYLLDTTTGQVWVWTVFDSGKPTEFHAWHRMARIDTLDDDVFEYEFKANYGVKAWDESIARTRSKKSAGPDESSSDSNLQPTKK